MEAQQIKALLMISAYEAALASVGANQNIDSTPVNPDSLVKDLGLQKKNILVYEEAKLHYAVLVQALQDQTGIWPDPVLPAGALGSGLSGVAPILQTLLKAGTPTSAIITALQGLLTSTVTGPVPSPNPVTPPASPPVPPSVTVPTPAAPIPLK